MKKRKRERIKSSNIKKIHPVPWGFLGKECQISFTTITSLDYPISHTRLGLIVQDLSFLFVVKNSIINKNFINKEFISGYNEIF